MNNITIKKYSADWCHPCRMMAPVIKEIKEFYGDKLTVVDVDIDDPNDEDVSSIKSIPTIVFFKNNAEIARTVGFQIAETLKGKINEML